jgi:hypothetical protein
MPVVDVKGLGVVEFPDTMKAGAIKAAIKRRLKPAQSDTTAVPRGTPEESFGRQATRHLLHGIPPAGMTAGGALGFAAGGPLPAVAGATAGGYGGRLLEEHLLKALGMEPDQAALAKLMGAAPGSMEASTLGAAQEGVVGAASEFSGAKLAEMLNPIARAIYRQALGKGGRVAAEGFSTGVPVSRGGLCRVQDKLGRLEAGVRAGDQGLAPEVAVTRQLEAALEKASERRASELLPLLTGGGAYAGSHDPLAAVLTALLARLAGNPAVTSRAAMGLATPAAADVTRNVPRLATTLIEQLLLEQPQGGEQ